MTVTVSARGQMVIPAVIRRRYCIKPNSIIELLDLGNEVVIVPMQKQSLLKSRGILKGISSADLIKARQAERRRERIIAN